MPVLVEVANKEREKVLRSDVKKDSALRLCKEAAQLNPVAYVSRISRKVHPLTPLGVVFGQTVAHAAGGRGG